MEYFHKVGSEVYGHGASFDSCGIIDELFDELPKKVMIKIVIDGGIAVQRKSPKGKSSEAIVDAAFLPAGF